MCFDPEALHVDYQKGTALLLLGVASSNAVGWTLLFEFGLGAIMTGWTALLISIVVIGAVIPESLQQIRIWWFWLALSGAGLFVNLVTITIQHPALLSLGLLNPWFVILAVGFIATSLYKRDDPRLNRRQRGVFLIAGVGGLAGLGVSTLTSLGVAVLIGILMGISVIPCFAVGMQYLL